MVGGITMKETLKWLWRITKENFGNKADNTINIEFDKTNDLKVMGLARYQASLPRKVIIA